MTLGTSEAGARVTHRSVGNIVPLKTSVKLLPGFHRPVIKLQWLIAALRGEEDKRKNHFSGVITLC